MQAVEGDGYEGLKFLLHTNDAHSLYARFGFRAPSERVMERP